MQPTKLLQQELPYTSTSILASSSYGYKANYSELQIKILVSFIYGAIVHIKAQGIKTKVNLKRSLKA